MTSFPAISGISSSDTSIPSRNSRRCSLRANPNEGWDIEQTAARLYVEQGEVAEVLARLSADGLLRCIDGRYRFGCDAAEQQAMVDRLAAAYSLHLIPVTAIIHAKPR